MKSRLIDNGLIQPLPHPYHAHRGDFVESDFHEAQCLSLKKIVPSDKCHVILQYTITYVIMLHFELLPYFREYFMPVESPEMFITVYWL